MSENVMSIRDEIRQSRPFKNRRQEALVALMRTSDDVRRFLGRQVECAGITLQQYNVLRILRGAGSEALPTLEIADRMLERTPGVTRLLDRLEENGLVERERCREDRRRVLCSITSAGLEVLESLDAAVDAADVKAMGGLAEAELAGFIDGLDRLRSRIREAAQ